MQSHRTCRRWPRWLAGAFILLLALLALALRTADLSGRPMHHDEANQAVRAGLLMDEGVYEYDPREHHGPTLYYFSLPVAWLRGQKTFARTDERTFRMVPVLFGALTLALTLWLLRDLGGMACIWAVVFGAISPGLFFYNRFYIQESLLVCFTFGLLVAGRRYWCTRRLRWAILAGLSFGLMHATKETCVLAWGAMGIAAACQLRTPTRLRKVCRRLDWRHAAWFAGVAAFVSITLFSSFFTHWRGPLDSILTYGAYLGRSGEGRHTHSSPWYYLHLILWQKEGGVLFRPELAIGILAAIGCLGAFLRRDSRAGFARFLVIYVASLTAIYSVLSYKTPWCILSSLHGMTLLAGVGMDTIWRLRRRWWTAIPVCVLGVWPAWFTFQQCLLVNSRFKADERNPYVYVHTSPNYLKMVRRIQDVADISEQGRGLFVAVVASEENTWPLPWYLRRYTSVGYWNDPADLPAEPAHPALVVTTPDLDEALAHRLGEDYVTEYYGLRPAQSVLVVLHVRRDLWDRFMETRTASP